MSTLILLRHGQSVWNVRNLFTGWVDIPLTAKGINEALSAGRKIADVAIDVVFTSSLMRAQQTAMIAISQHHHNDKTPVIQHPRGYPALWSKIHDQEVIDNVIPVYATWHLNERFYGELQGLNKHKVSQIYGDDQVYIWRRSFSTPPPKGESLKMTAERTLPYFNEYILPQLKSRHNVLVTAHGNSLRSIIMQLEQLTEDQVSSLELSTGVPRFYDFQLGKFSLIQDPH